jgi:hypothetical protein
VQAARLARLTPALPLWDGGALDGGTLLVTRDQGLGDFVLWSRLFGTLRERGIRIAVECPEALVPLYRAEPAIGELIAGTCAPERLGAFAAFVPVGSLPQRLGVGPGEPSPLAYLQADPERVRAFRDAFASLDRRRAVGLVWAGEPTHRLDRFRSAPLDAFAALAGVPDIAWVRLQQGPRGDDPPPPGIALVHLDPFADFGETAAAIAALDLVITVDTSVAHVAGALGAPVWMLNGFGHAWMWGVGRTDTPWYPSMRLFRQPVPARWDGLFAEVRAQLERWALSPS